MSESAQRRSVRKKLLLLVLLVFVGFGLLLYFQQETLKDTWETLLDADLRYVLLLPVLQSLNYFFIGNYYKGMFQQFGAKITQARAWGVVAAMNFVNQVLPSGGLSGITYLAYGFHSKISAGKTTLVQIGRYMFAFGAYALLLPFAIFLLISDGRSEELSSISNKAIENGGIIATLAVFLVFVAIVVASFVNESFSHVLGRTALRFINWFNTKVLRRRNNYQFKFLKKLNREFHEGVNLVREEGFRALRPGVFMLFSVFVEISIVFVSVLAVGGDVGIAPVFLAFVAANIVGVVSIIPGDVGVHEATVILVLVAFGVDEPVAISATLLYRVFNKLIFMPIGFFFYTRILKPALEADEYKKAA